MSKTKVTEIIANRVISITLQEDGTYKVLLEVKESEEQTSQEANPKATIFDDFVLIEASKLSMDDEFMQHEPMHKREREFKKLLSEVIKKEIKNFYKPRGDMSFTEDGSGICYAPGNMPAVVVGKFYNWHEAAAKNFKPELNSRLGTKDEYVAFLGVLLKTLVAEGWDVAKAWHAVCVNSEKIGHYRNSEAARDRFEPTGSRAICGFCDLANTYKILACDDEACGFWLAGGNYNDLSFDNPLSDLYLCDYRNCNLIYSTGWLVLS